MEINIFNCMKFVFVERYLSGSALIMSNIFSCHCHLQDYHFKHTDIKYIVDNNLDSLGDVNEEVGNIYFLNYELSNLIALKASINPDVCMISWEDASSSYGHLDIGNFSMKTVLLVSVTICFHVTRRCAWSIEI